MPAAAGVTELWCGTSQKRDGDRMACRGASTAPICLGSGCQNRNVETRGVTGTQEALGRRRTQMVRRQVAGPGHVLKATASRSSRESEEGWFELSIEEWNVKRTDDGRQEQSRKKLKQQQQSPATDSWTVDFMTRQGESRECIQKWLKCRSISWKKRRRLLQVLTGTFPCGHWLNKIGRGQGKGCGFCARREAGSRPGRLEV